MIQQMNPSPAGHKIYTILINPSVVIFTVYLFDESSPWVKKNMYLRNTYILRFAQPE